MLWLWLATTWHYVAQQVAQVGPSLAAMPPPRQVSANYYLKYLSIEDSGAITYLLYSKRLHGNNTGVRIKVSNLSVLI